MHAFPAAERTIRHWEGQATNCWTAQPCKAAACRARGDSSPVLVTPHTAGHLRLRSVRVESQSVNKVSVYCSYTEDQGTSVIETDAKIRRSFRMGKSGQRFQPMHLAFQTRDGVPYGRGLSTIHDFDNPTKHHAVIRDCRCIVTALQA